MSNETKLASVWASVESLIDDGISIMPVYDRAVGNKNAKDPCLRTWKALQSERMDKGELWQAMQTYDTTAVAAITGEVSGRLELIDVDSKYEPGIEALLLKDIEAIYPHIYPLLRIHATPSGGRHIIYRIEDGDVPGSQKLAGREKSEEELQDDRKRTKQPSRTVNFLETRGEGGYFLYPPSLGYTVIQDVPIPLLTWEERCGLINLCKSYDRIVKIEPTPRPTKKEDDWYTTNPFEDFNQSCDPIALMEEFGWKVLSRHDNRYIWFTRPGKEKGISASFNQSKRVFWIFTSSTDLVSGKGYNPASILAELKFQGDKKRAFRHLVDNGYGDVKRDVEQRLLKKAAIEGKRIPENFSDEAKEQHAVLSKQHKDNHPHGKFWERNKDRDWVVNIENFIEVAKELGFRSHPTVGVVQINRPYIDKVDEVFFYDFMKSYIKIEDPDEKTLIREAFEKFIKTYGKFIADKRLPSFEDEDVLADTADTCYKFYNNVYIEITASQIRIKQYDELEDLVWSDKIMSRKYESDVAPSSLYKQYLINATDPARQSVQHHVKSLIGWLCHDFNSPARIYFAVLIENVPDAKDGGGSGKNIFVNVLSNMIGVSTASGAMVKWDDKFFAVWRPTDRVYFIPDIPKEVDWPFLKNAVENPLVNKKYDREVSISTTETPKLILNTNYSYKDVDGGLKRRIIPIEFTPYYTINGGVDTVHQGKLFPSKGFEGNWSKEDWKGFDDFVIHCIQVNLADEGKLYPTRLSDVSWVKKFINTYGEDNYEFIRDNLPYWLSSEVGGNYGYVRVTDLQQSYDSYITSLKEKYKLRKGRLMSAIKDYCDRHEISLQTGVQKKVNSINGKYHVFIGELPEQEVEDDGAPF